MKKSKGDSKANFFTALAHFNCLSNTTQYSEWNIFWHMNNTKKEEKHYSIHTKNVRSQIFLVADFSCSFILVLLGGV